MPNLKDLKTRIGSVKSTQKITKAMQLVAAAKLKRAQEQAEAGRPYATRMASVVANLSAAVKDSPAAPPMLIGSGKDETHLLIVATADRGLCGGFNASIVRLARERIVELERAGKTVKLLLVGIKGADQLKRLHGEKIIDTISLRDVKKLDSSHAAAVSEHAARLFESGEVDVVTIIFSRFKNVLTQVPTVQTLIPAADSVEEDAAGPDLKGALYEYEPDEEAILAELLPRNLTTQVYSALLENAAGEQGARMSAMDNATRNAGDMIDDLSLQYNRARQANITTELIEIIAGAEAL